MVLFYTVICTSLVGFCFFYEYLKPVKITSYISEKYEGWKTLTSMVGTYNTSRVSTILGSISIIIQAILSKIKINKGLKNVDKHTYELAYKIKGKHYKMLMKPSRKPHPVITVTNDKGHDLTDIIIPYMGPNHDWHYFEFTPKFFNQDTLIFELHSGTIKEFKLDDKIRL